MYSLFVSPSTKTSSTEIFTNSIHKGDSHFFLYHRVHSNPHYPKFFMRPSRLRIQQKSDTSSIIMVNENRNKAPKKTSHSSLGLLMRSSFIHFTNRKIISKAMSSTILSIFTFWNFMCFRAFADSPSTTLTTTSSTSLSFFLVSKISELMSFVKCNINLRKAVFLISIPFLIREIALTRASHKRQKLDPTSEWGRYADYPGARGRALGKLCMKVLALTIASSITKLLKREQFSRAIKTKTGKLFADGLLKLGPLYIKIGQIISCREEAIPEEWIKELERLQDCVPAKSGQAARELAYRAFGSKEEMERILDDFDDVPIAAASLGQVHVGYLKPNAITNDAHTIDINGDTRTHNVVNGNFDNERRKVAIKIQRERLRDIYDKDLALMKKMAVAGDKIMAAVGGVQQSWVDIFQDAETILYREIDYRKEAENAIRFANDFGIGYNGASVTPSNPDLPSASSWLRTPYIYQDQCSEQILIQEYVPSIKINNYEALDAANITMTDRKNLAENLARAYLRQFCCHQFFSTDPHPGNLGVEIPTEKGKRPRLVFYDFGQACSLQKDQADGILDVIEGITDLDAHRCVKAFDKMGVLVEDANLDVVTRKVQQNFDTGKIKVRKKKNPNQIMETATILEKGKIIETHGNHDATMNNVTTTNGTIMDATSNASENVKDKDVMPYFILPAEYAFVARALSQMNGVGKGLDEDYDFISATAPYIIEVKGAETFVKEKAQKFVTQLEEKGLAFMRQLGFIKETSTNK